jgi:GGDEF domain-containing protein
MSDANPYLDLVGAAAPTAAPTPSPTPAAVDNPYLAVVDADTADDAEGNARLVTWFDRSITQAPDRYAGVEALARATGVDSHTVDLAYDEWKRTAAVAKFNPAVWRRDNPGLYRTLLEHPALAPIVHGPEGGSDWWLKIRGLLAGMAEYGAGSTSSEPGVASAMGMAASVGTPGAAQATQIGADIERQQIERAGAVQAQESQRKIIATQKNPIAQKTGLAWLGAATTDAAVRSFEGSYAAHLGSAQAMLDLQLEKAVRSDASALELERARRAAHENQMRLLDIERTEGVTQDYEAGPLGSLWLRTVGAGAALAPFWATKVPGKLLGAGVGALTKSPVAGVATAKAAELALNYAFAWDQQFGNTYRGLRDAKDESGRPIDREVAIGFAAAYATAAAGIDVGAVQTFGKMFGAPADLLKTPGAEGIQGFVLSRARRDALKALGKAWAEGAATGGAQLGAENVLGQLTRWAATSASQGAPASLGRGELVAGALESGARGVVDMALVGLAHGVVAGVPRTELALRRMEIQRRNAAEAAHTAAALSQIPGTLQADAMPEAIARAIQYEAEHNGRRVDSVFHDPKAVMDLATAQHVDVEQLATELLGPDGPARLKAALDERVDAPAQRSTLEVPLADYLGRWGGRGAARALARDASVLPGHETLRELEQIATEEAAREQVLQTEIAQRSPDLAPAQVALQAHEQTLRERARIPGGLEAPMPSASLESSRRAFAALSPEARKAELFTDPNTALLNERGDLARPPDPERPLRARFSLEGFKHLNDTEGHATADGALRAMAQALRAAGIEDGVYRGGDIEADVRDPAQAQQIAAAMEKAVDPLGRVRVTPVTAPRAPDYEKTGQALGDAMKVAKAAAEGQGRRAPRGQIPVGLTAPAAAGLEAPPWGPGLAGAPKPPTAPLGEEHAAGFAAAEAAGTTFETIHRDSSGLWNGRGFERSREVQPRAFVASADVRNVQRLNQEFGRPATNKILDTLSRVLAKEGGGAFDAARLHGDEYAAQATDARALDIFFAGAQTAAREHVFYRERPDGSVVVQEGLDFDYATGKTLDEADRQKLPAVRAARTQFAEPRVLTREAFAERRAEIRRDHPDYELVDVGSVDVESLSARGRAAASRDRKQEALSAEVTPPAAARGTADRTQTRGFGSKANAWDTMMQESYGSRDASPTEQADSAYRAWKAGKGPKPPPFPGGTFDHINEQIGLRGDERVSSAYEAFDLLSRGTRAWDDLGPVVDALAQTAGLEKIRLPEAVLSRQMEERALAAQDAAAEIGVAAPLFASAEAAGMTAEAYDRYVAGHGEALARVWTEVQREAQRARDEMVSPTWRAEVAAHRVAAEQEWEQRRDWQVWRYIHDGEVRDENGQAVTLPELGKLDRGTVRLLHGRRIETRLGDRLVTGGEDPTEVAVRFGYPNALRMLDDILALPQRDPWIAARAEELTRDAHPDVALAAQRPDELVQRVVNDGMRDWLVAELDALQKRAGDTTPVQEIARAARELVGQKPVRRLAPGATLNRERAAADAAIAAAARGDVLNALDAKKRQVLAHFTYKELAAARDDRDGFDGLAGDLAKEASRGRLGKAGPAYRDVVDSLLESLGVVAPRPQDVPRRGLVDLVQQLEANGDTVAFDPEVLQRLITQPREWKSLSVDELREVLAALKNIRQGARNRTSVLVGEKRMATEEVVQALLDEARANLPDRGPAPSSVPAMSLAQAGGAAVSGLYADSLRPELLVDWLGGRKMGSMWRRAIVEPLQRAKVREAELLQQTIKPIADAFAAIPRAVRARLMETVPGAALFPTHRTDLEAPTRRFELLMMALNRGNDSNIDRLTAGRGISLPQVDAALGTLTREEITWAQSVWDAAESLWPLARDLEERNSGVAPPHIEATPFTIALQDGTEVHPRGGYFPAVYDRRVSAVGERQAINSVADLMDASYTRLTTARSYLKARAQQFSDVLALDPGIIGAHLAQVAHDIAYREALQSVGGLVLNFEVQGAFKRYLGQQKAEEFLAWLKDVGQMRGPQIASQARNLTRLMRAARSNAMIATIGYSANVALGDLSLLAMAPVDLTMRHWFPAYTSFLVHPAKLLRFVYERSGELRSRDDLTQRSIKEQVQALTSRGGYARQLLDTFRAHAYTFFEWTEKATATPVWLAAYSQARAEGKSESLAIDFADKFVRDRLPARSPLDQSAILRDKGFIGSSLMFYGWANMMLNRYGDAAHDLYLAVGHERSRGGKALAFAKALPRVTGKIMALAVTSNVLGELFSGRGPQASDGEDDLERWRNWFVRKTLMGPIGSLPWVGGAFESLVLGKPASVRTSPGFAAVEQAGKALSKAWQDGDASGEQAFWAALKAAGIATGVPVVAPSRAIEYLTSEEGAAQDLDEGSLLGLPSGIIYGKRPDQPLNPITLVGGGGGP